DPRTAERIDRCPICLVERRLEHEVDLHLVAQRQQRPRHAQRVLARLDHARPGDEEGRLIATERDVVSDGDRTCGHAPGIVLTRCRIAAVIDELRSRLDRIKSEYQDLDAATNWFNEE